VLSTGSDAFKFLQGMKLEPPEPKRGRPAQGLGPPSKPTPSTEDPQ